jgi:hypothetical protein
MKKTLVAVVFSIALAANSYADLGRINFLNSFATRIALHNTILGDMGFTPTNSGGFKYQLFVAPAGTTDPLLFTATNVKGTNLISTGAAGRFLGGFNLEVNGVQAGEMRSILVRGWSSYLGDDYATAKDNWDPFFNGYLGESSIAPNFIFGGFDGSGPIPASPAFGGSFGIQSGFTLVGVPEPAAGTILILGTTIIFRGLRRKKTVGI